jgi:hypothetical protein
VIFATVYLIYNQQQSKVLEKLAQITEAAAPSTEPVAAQEPISEPETSEAETETQEAPPVELAAADAVEAVATTFPVKTTSTSRMAEEVSRSVVPPDQKMASSFSIVFAEVPQALLAQLFEGASDVNQTGTLADLPARLNKLKALKSAESLKILSRSPLSFEGGVAKHSEFLGSSGRGLAISVATRGFNTDFISVEVLIENRGLIAGSDAADASTQSFQGVFDLAPKAAGYFADIISKPTGLTKELEAEISRSKVFQILNSPAYNQRQSSLFIFFENGSY